VVVLYLSVTMHTIFYVVLFDKMKTVLIVHTCITTKANAEQMYERLYLMNYIQNDTTDM